MRQLVCVALGTQAVGAANIYGSFHNIAVKCVERACEVPAQFLIVAVFTRYADLLFDDLHHIYSVHEQYDAPGMIVARTAQALEERAEKALRNVSCEQRRYYPSTKLILKAPQSPSHRADIEEAISRREGDRRSLYLATMSDGLDGYLGARSLCGIKDTDLSHIKSGTRCISTQYCFRHRGSLQGVLGSSEVVSAKSLSASFIFFSACWGLLPEDAIERADFSLVEAWLALSQVDFVVTTWELTIGDLDLLETVFDEIVSGCTPSRAIARFNRSDDAARTGIRLCLIGRAGEILVDQECRQVDDWQGQPIAKGENNPTSFLTAYVAQVLHQEPDLRNRRDWLQVFEAISNAALPLKDKQTAVGKAISGFCTAVYMPWMRMSVPLGHEGFVPCPNCGTIASQLAMTCASRPITRRIVIKCPRCGVALDKDATLPVDGIKLNRDALTISFSSHLPNLRIWLTIEKYVGSMFIAKELSAVGEGRSELRFSVETADLYDTRWICITILSGLRIAVSRLPIPMDFARAHPIQ